MSALAEKKQSQTNTPARPRVFWQILESRIWTNRTDKRLQDKLVQLKNWAFNLESRLQALKTEESIAVIKSEIDKLEKENLSIIQEVVPNLYKLYVKASDNAAAMDSDIIQLTKYNDELESLKLAKLERKFRRKLSSLKNKIDKLLGISQSQEVRREIVPGELNYHEVECMPVDPKFSRFANVSNEGTPLSFYPNWATVFHYQGKRYGTTKPAVSDCVQKIFNADALVSFKGKKILELGSFEGGNTKQISDCGAQSVIGIEANPEFFTKSLLVKNFFQLDNIDFIYGNCVNLLRTHEKLKDQKFDICFVSGILYHMEDPLELIELVSHTSDIVYVWTQVADDSFPKAQWEEVKDSNGTSYQSKRNIYTTSQKWGGVSTGARWLAEESMKQAFTSRGYELNQYATERTGTGLAISFVATKK